MYPRILIAGVPGAGKTEIGKYLQSNKQFTHYDVEETGMPDLETLALKSVLTWGFVPDDRVSLGYIVRFIASGGKMIWLDGNRCASKMAFKKRNTVSMQFYQKQIAKIEKHEESIHEKFHPIYVNPFDSSGIHRTHDAIARDILNLIIE